MTASADLYFQNGFYINPNLIVTNNGTVTINFQLLGGNASSTWMNAAGATLNVEDNLLVGAGGGTLVASATGNTVNYNGGAETLKQPVNNDYYNLIVSGSGTKTLQGDINVHNDLSITSSLTTADFDIYLSGNWSNSNVFNEGVGEVIFTGSGDQSISNPVGETFYDLKLDKPSGSLQLNNAVRVSNALTMDQGNIVTNANSFILGTGIGSTGSINHTSGTIVGALERWIDTPASSYDFPIGTASAYRPATLTFNNLNAGSLVGEFIALHPVTRDCPWTMRDSR